MTPGPRPSHAAFEELAVGYALHALEPDEELRFTAHLSGCASCTRAVAEHEETLAELAGTAAAEPPPALLDSIRAEVARTPRAPGPAELPPLAGVVVPPAGAEVVDLAERRRASAVPVRRSWLLSAAAGVTALLLGLGAWNVALRGDLGDEQLRADRLSQTVSALETRDARAVQLSDFSGDVRAVVIAHGAQMSLVVDGLAVNDPETVYVLWGQTDDGEVRALSTFDVATEGLDVLHGMPLQLPVTDLQALMVTHEQGRTPPAQTQERPLIAGSVSA